MFTGIVRALGTVISLKPRPSGAVIQILAPRMVVKSGESIAVDGVCLTALEARRGRFEADLSEETLVRSALGKLRQGHRVNLERSLRSGSPLGGHFVLGHVDARGRVVSLSREARAARLVVCYPLRYHAWVVEKGSIAVNGVSLTVAACRPGTFEAALIPFTLEATNLGGTERGAPVNLEFDYLAKLVGHWLELRESGSPGARRKKRRREP